jgi:predicted phage terminase large subunit-like protein
MNLKDIDQQQALIQIDQELCKRSLHEFVQMAWSLIEPGKQFYDNWHIRAICEHLQAVTNGDIKRLIINVPPGSMKSLNTCVFWPAWSWTIDPSTKWIFASYSTNLSRRDANRTRTLMESDWYQQRWGDVWQPNTKEWRTDKFSNDQGGMRLSTSVEGGVTGDHADIQVVDDPIKPIEVTGSTAVARTTLEKAATWWKETMSSRMTDFKKSSRVIIMQRLHQGDLVGVALAEDPDYVHLRLPMEFELGHRCKTRLPFADPRIDDKQLLWPERYDEAVVKKLKKDLGSRASAAQLQQRPSPAKGAIFKRDWIKYYDEPPPMHKATIIQSWDCAFKDTKTSSYVVGQVWAAIGNQYYLLHQVRDRLGLSATCTQIMHMSLRYPKAYQKIIEDKANGPAVVDSLKNKLNGLKLVNPEGGKEARANAVEPLWEAGQVHIPHPNKLSWVSDFEEELVTFPAAMNDDQVDCMTQALNYLQHRSMVRYKMAMRNVGTF